MATLEYLTLTDPSQPARPRHLAYREWGEKSNREVVVCVHGLSRNSRDFDFVAKELSKTHRVICPDMAGRGKSSWLSNKADYNYSLYILDCLVLLDTLKLERVGWVGTSMGGIVGMMLAAAQKQRIKRMVLNDVGAIVSAEGLKRILGYVGLGSAFANRDEAFSHFKSIIAPFHITSEANMDYMFEISMVKLPDGRYAFAYDPAINQPFRDAVSKPEGITDVDLTGFWNEVACPVLIIRGEHSDILSKTAADAMCNRTQTTKYVEIKDTGHAPALLEESQVQLISDWMSAGS